MSYGQQLTYVRDLRCFRHTAVAPNHDIRGQINESLNAPPELLYDIGSVVSLDISSGFVVSL